MTIHRSGQRGIDAREAAVLAVRGALSGDRFAAGVIRELRSQREMDPRDASLASEIALGVVRHAVTLEHVLSSATRYDASRVSPQVRAILLCGAYQLVYMDRIPEFAAVDESVRLASGADRSAAGMINAVLRNIGRAIESRRAKWPQVDPEWRDFDPRLAHFVRVGWENACEFSINVLPTPNASDHSIAFLAAATGERPARLRTIVDAHGHRAAIDAAWASQALPASVWQRNPLRVGAEPFRTAVTAQIPEAEFSDEPAPLAAFVPGAASITGNELFESGGAFVQDCTARAAADALAVRPGERVLDYCAAPGGKTLALAIAMKDRGEIVACDVDEQRLARVRENAERLGLASIETRLIGKGAAVPEGEFDAVLVDVPCSNSGVIARRPEARWGMWPQAAQSPFVLDQCAILARASALVRRGGRLLYSTCSIEPSENESVVCKFVAENRGWSMDATKLTLPAWGARLSDWRDGGFHARLIRTKA